jgi:GAF domain-containing protein
VPVVTVTLIDTNRQWFKSCVGLESEGTSRELSFCAHVVAERRDLVVPDTFEDDRFADHPLVTGAPRIRFYAGFPVYHADGACLGTLCLIDTRPRQLSGRVLESLREVATLVEQELNTPFSQAA